MFRYKLDKKTIIIAAMVILLCLVSITGATFALFTSGVEDGTVGINTTSGNLKLDIISDDPDNPTSLVGDVLNFIPKDGESEILFEPGATYRTQGFRVKNNGNVLLNYILYLSNDDSVSDNFFDVFDVWITTDVSSLENGIPPQDFDGRLGVGEISDVYYLVFQMKPSAGNEHQKQLFNGVGITVYATQGNVDAHEIDPSKYNDND